MKDLIAALQSLTLPWDAISGARIVLDGVNGRILIYDAADDLVLSVSPLSGTDPSGNDVFRGFTAYDPGAGGNWATLRSGNLRITDTSGDVVTLVENGLIQATLADFAGDTIQLVMDGDGGFTFRKIGTSRTTYWNAVDGFLYAAVGAHPPAPENWTAANLNAGWAVRGSETVKYRLCPDGMVKIRGSAIRAAGVPPDGTVVFNLPAGYRPVHQSLYPRAYWGSNTCGRVLIATGGNVEVHGAPSSEVSFDGIELGVF